MVSQNRQKKQKKEFQQKSLKPFYFLAQRRGFEPPVRFRRTHDFQSQSVIFILRDGKFYYIFRSADYINPRTL